MTPLLDFLVEMEASPEIDRRDRALVERLLRRRLRDFLADAEFDPTVPPYRIEQARRHLMHVESGLLGADRMFPLDDQPGGTARQRLCHLDAVLEA
ncbi:MAG: hypothetical protein ACKO5K_00625 [Armatimonadota bacterium]